MWQSQRSLLRKDLINNVGDIGRHPQWVAKNKWKCWWWLKWSCQKCRWFVDNVDDNDNDDFLKNKIKLGMSMCGCGFLIKLCLLLWTRYLNETNRYHMPHMPEQNWTNTFYIWKTLKNYNCPLLHNFITITEISRNNSLSICSSHVCSTVSFHNYRYLIQV